MILSLCHINDRIGEAWKHAFDGTGQVEITKGDITKIASDAVVSPANSFGFMDGGLDAALIRRFGLDLEGRVKAAIQNLPEGELLVGQSLVVTTNDVEIPQMIVAPTMRVPMSYNINTSVNAYLAMKTILLTAMREGYGKITVPSLCTGVGRMDPEISANQMLIAYREVICGLKRSITTFGDAQKHQLEVNPKSMIWDF